MYWPARGRRRDGLRRTASAGRACDSSRACGQTSLRAGAIAWDQGAGIPRSPGETVFPRMPWESWEESSGQMSARKGPQALNLRGKMETARALGFPGGAAHSSNRCAHMGRGLPISHAPKWAYMREDWAAGRKTAWVAKHVRGWRGLRGAPVRMAGTIPDWGSISMYYCCDHFPCWRTVRDGRRYPGRRAKVEMAPRNTKWKNAFRNGSRTILECSRPSGTEKGHPERSDEMGNGRPKKGMVGLQRNGRVADGIEAISIQGQC